MNRAASSLLPVLLLASFLKIGCAEPVARDRVVAGETQFNYAGYTFTEFDWPEYPADVTRERLCSEAADPDSSPNKTHIHCRLEGVHSAPRSLAGKNSLMVAAYNVERGFHSADHIRLYKDGVTLPTPDILLLSEVDRGCKRTGYRNVMREYAEALGMDGVYGTEFVELHNDVVPGTSQPVCEHGNAILSRYPLGNVGQIRFDANRSWYVGPAERPTGDEPRLGGRLAVFADVKVGEKILHVYAVHLESELAPRYRDNQARQLVADAGRLPFGVIIGGDTNSPFYFLDIATGNRNDSLTQVFLQNGFHDAHATLPAHARVTHPPFLVLDEIFGKGINLSAPGLCPASACGSLSDHLPIWTTVDLR